MSGELSRQSYLVALTFAEDNDDLGVLRGIAEDACDLVEGHWRVKAELVGTRLVCVVEDHIREVEAQNWRLLDQLNEVSEQYQLADRRVDIMREAAARLRPLARRAIVEPGESGDQARRELHEGIDWLIQAHRWEPDDG